MCRTTLSIAINEEVAVSGILQVPAKAAACCVMAHGVGASMTHPFLSAVADGLADRRIATLRYQFPLMERGSKRTDRPVLVQATVRAAVAEAKRLLSSLPMFAGGKSFGARMTSQAQAEAPLPEIRGLVFLGFPLHRAKRPSDTRAQHLFGVQIPMLFLQGTRGALADMSLLKAVVDKLGTSASFVAAGGGNHAFHVSRRSGKTDAEVLAEMLEELATRMAVKTDPKASQ